MKWDGLATTQNFKTSIKHEQITDKINDWKKRGHFPASIATKWTVSAINDNDADDNSDGDMKMTMII